MYQFGMTMAVISFFVLLFLILIDQTNPDPMRRIEHYMQEANKEGRCITIVSDNGTAAGLTETFCPARPTATFTR